jgi:hypothetical protein
MSLRRSKEHHPYPRAKGTGFLSLKRKRSSKISTPSTHSTRHSNNTNNSPNNTLASNNSRKQRSFNRHRSLFKGRLHRLLGHRCYGKHNTINSPAKTFIDSHSKQLNSSLRRSQLKNLLLR